MLRAAAMLLLVTVFAQATTVLAVRTDERVVLGADSRVQLVRGTRTALSTGCKMHRSGDIVWSHAGYAANPETGFDLAAIGNRAFAGSGALKDRMQRLARAVTEPLHRALLALRDANPSAYDEDIAGPLKVVAAGVDGGAPVLAVAQFERSGDGHLESKFHYCPGDCSSGMEYVSAGSHSEADRIVRETPDYFRHQEWLEDFRRLLDAEAAARPSDVTAPYSIVEVSPAGIRWLDRGLCRDLPAR